MFNNLVYKQHELTSMKEDYTYKIYWSFIYIYIYIYILHAIKCNVLLWYVEIKKDGERWRWWIMSAKFGFILKAD